MKILVTGAKGFAGKNLCGFLNNIKNGFDLTHPEICIEEVFEYDAQNSKEELAKFCRKADFVFHFAGVNRPEREEDFEKGNVDFTKTLLSTLEAAKNPCPVMFASSIQATLVGRYNNPYGKSKKAAEDLVFEHGEKTGAPVYVFRFPNLFGKWAKPGYNSAVATFCHNVARGLPVTVNGENTKVELLYIDDMANAMLNLLCGKAERCSYGEDEHSPFEEGKFCYARGAFTVTLGEIVRLLQSFAQMPQSLLAANMPEDSFEKKLCSTYISYLPKDKVAFVLKKNEDERGSFTELLKTENCGQISVNISKPGITKGEHWHQSKWEIFTVVAGHGMIRQRKIGSDEIIETEVWGEKPTSVQTLPGYAHSIVNLSYTEDLITVIWANEVFNRQKPDTYSEKV